MIKTFESKRDTLLVVILWMAILGMLVTCVDMGLRGRWGIAVLLAPAAASTLWIFYGTRYVIRDGSLHIHSGPFRWHIPLASIIEVVPSRDNIASPASSLDRLEIRYAAGKKRVLVSPLEKEAFLAALRQSGPVSR